MWCFERLFVKSGAGRQRFNVLGALNAVTHELITVTNDSYINAQSVCELLHKIAALGLTIPISLVLDNARYQKCALVFDLAQSLNIELLYLTTYSPNLNLIERLWKFVKKSVSTQFITLIFLLSSSLFLLALLSHILLINLFIPSAILPNPSLNLRQNLRSQLNDLVESCLLVPTH